MTEMSEIRDVSVTPQETEVDIGVRANPGAKKPGVRTMQVDFSLICDTSSSALQAFRAAWAAKTRVAAAFLTGAKAASGSEGPSGDWYVGKFTRAETLNDAIKFEITVYCGENDFEWVTNGVEVGT
jgi:hypothetical protein